MARNDLGTDMSGPNGLTSPRSLRSVIVSSALPRYAQGRLPGALRRLVQATLEDDVELAARYHVLRALERQARVTTDADAELSRDQEDMLLAGVLAGLDGGLLPSTSKQADDGRRQPAPFLSMWPAGFAAAAAILFVVIGQPPADDDNAPLGLSPRGDEAPLGVRIRCVDEGRVIDDATAGARQTLSTLSCGDGGLLAFSLTNLSSHVRYVYIVGIDGDGGVVHLPPFGEEDQALRLEPGTLDAVADRLAPMPIVDERGATLHILVDHEPFRGADVARRLRSARVSALPLESVDRLPLDVDVQARLNLYRRP